MEINGLKIQLKDKTSSSAIISLSFSPEYEYFKGHFDEFSLLPALIQIKLVVDLSNEYFSLNFTPRAMPSMKFLKPICPYYQVELKIVHNLEKNRIEFEYKKDEDLYSKGTLKI
jgi:3-hydroxymyristoyl/3-hydroxydecanoyl-(acyl carrier protein) dehydratase